MDTIASLVLRSDYGWWKYDSDRWPVEENNVKRHVPAESDVLYFSNDVVYVVDTWLAAPHTISPDNTISLKVYYEKDYKQEKIVTLNVSTKNFHY